MPILSKLRWFRGGRLRRVVLAGLTFVVSATAGIAQAQSPLVAELESLVNRYHEDLGRIDTIRIELEAAVRDDPHPKNYLALARAQVLWGDIRASSAEQKLPAYAAGREAARRAMELAPREALAHVLYGVSTARWGQAKGILRSLTLLPDVRAATRRSLELDPGLAVAYALSGYVDFEVPVLFGGSLERAEEAFRRGLRLDPRFTAIRVGLARVLIRQDRVAEARRELEAVLAERAPTSLADWTVKDRPRAERLLSTLPRLPERPARGPAPAAPPARLVGRDGPGVAGAG
jgi:tetratricopeptide (TPR) repeat protein